MIDLENIPIADRFELPRGYYYVVKIHRRYSKPNDHFYYEMDIMDDAGAIWKCYVSEEHANYDNWLPIIEEYSETRAAVFSGRVKFKYNRKHNTTIINGDSVVYDEGSVNKNTLLNNVWHHYYGGDSE